ncbi:hypothetical protein D3C73_1361300 [compost metagenome]
MILLLLEKALRNEHREIRVAVSGSFEPAVHFLLDMFPDLVAFRFEYGTAADRRIIHQIRFFDYINIPAREILVLWRNFRNELLIFSHVMKSS